MPHVAFFPLKNNAQMNKLRIGITQGDTNGVGYEVIFKAFANSEMLSLCTPIIYGNEKIASFHKKSIEDAPSFKVITNPSETHEAALYLINTSAEECTVEYGKVKAEAGRQAQSALARAVSDWKAGLIDAIVTAPINKASIQSDSFSYTGHTEYFAAVTGAEPLMILSNEHVRVALLSTHLPISEVAKAVTKENLTQKIEMLHESLKRDYLLASPRIAVLALNPHCGDEGAIGLEEKEVIAPTIAELREKHVPCFGPYPADGFFGSGMYEHFDAVLAMYHDQGLAPLKALGMDEGVNFTAGLPLVRTSPDHGTAFDIAGQDKASPDSMRQAIYAAIDIYRNRKAYDEAHTNPLPFNPRRSERERMPSRD